MIENEDDFSFEVDLVVNDIVVELDRIESSNTDREEIRRLKYEEIREAITVIWNNGYEWGKAGPIRWLKSLGDLD